MILIVGAYGRKYKSLDEAKADWEAGKIFASCRVRIAASVIQSFSNRWVTLLC